MFTFQLLACITVCALYYWFQWIRQRKRLLELAEKAPMLEGYLPVIGHGYKLLGGGENFLKFIKETALASVKVGGVIHAWMGTGLYYVITDPEDASTVLSTCLQKHKIYKVASSWLGDGLLFADVHKWKQNRKLLNPAFNQRILDGFLEVFNEQARSFVGELERHSGMGDFSPRGYITDLSIKGIYYTVLGVPTEGKSIISKEYKPMVEKALSIFAFRMTNLFLHFNFIYNMTSMKKQEMKAVNALHNITHKILKKRKQERKEESINVKLASDRRFRTFLDILLDMTEEGILTEEHMRAELDTITVGGFDTSATAMQYVLIYLGSYPDVQEKMYQELISVLGVNGDVDKDNINKLFYTEAVIKECMRVNPVIPIVARDIDRDLQLKNFTLPAGSGCVISIWGIHRLPCWGPDADQFKPERWMQPQNLAVKSGAYLAFSTGKRSCIGKTYAIMFMKTSLAHIIRKYKISSNINELKCKFEIFTVPVAGERISVVLR